MTDSTLNRFLSQGTNAERVAFTPDPPTPASGPDPTYIWVETDTGDTFSWDGAAWQQVNNGGDTADWGGISGTLSDQTDLQAALDAKAATTYVDAGDASTLADAETYTDAAIASISGGGEGAPLNGIVSGCGVAYTGSLGFSMSAGTAYIDGTLVTAAAQNITLNAADGSNPRIDVLYLDDTGTFGKITGTASASPSEPAIDATSQLKLTFVLVPTAATDLNAGITTETIYDEGSEWTPTTSGSGFTANSTNNPNTGTKCIEGTAVAAGAYVKFVDGSPSTFDGDGNLLLSIRSKASWNNKRSLTLRWYASGVAKGSAVSLKTGSFGFTSSNTASYQLLIISKALFAIPAGTTIDELRITAAGSGGSAIGFYIDPIQLQTVSSDTGGGGNTSGITQDQADARYAQRANNLSDLNSASTARTNLGATTAGANLFTLANPSAITFLRVNADNTVDALSASSFRTAIGAGVGGGDMVSTNNLSDVANAGTARTNLGLGTGDSPQFTAINIGHASDTTITRTGAGDIAVEGNAVYRAGGTDVPVTDGGTGASSASSARTNLGATTVGGNIFTLTNPSAITFLRVNADNTVDALSASAFRTAIGAGVGGGDLVSTNNLSDVANAGTSRTNLGVGTGDSPQFTAINLGHASDTTITRVSAGVIAVEGVTVPTTFATASDLNTGTDTTKIVNSDSLAGSNFGKAVITILVSDPAGSAITTGDGKAYYRVPSALNGMNLVSVAAAVTTVSSSGIPTVQIANVTDSVDMLSTKLTIDANETDSSTAANAAVIDGAHDDVATGDMLRIDIDVAGTGAKGLMVEMQFQLP